jgi:ergothioneine biosynthesis protein EgtB
MLLHSGLPPRELTRQLHAARARLKALCSTLAADEWLGPYAPTLNPPLWELGHIAWFQEHWCLRIKPSIDPDASPLLEPLLSARRPWADWLYNSSRIPHGARWQAPLPSAADTLAYADEVLYVVSDKLAASSFEDDFLYFVELCLYHELMHVEAWWMNWQARGLAPPEDAISLPTVDGNEGVRFDRGIVVLGSERGQGFVFDNEKWAHEVALDAFEIDARPVSCGEFARFVEDRGYARPELWSTAGREWLARSTATQPVYWRQSQGRWQTRRFNRWIDLPSAEPVMHVSRFEAEAYCTWRGRRLPGAAEWLRATRQEGFALGRCWEWTRDAFAPYPGFSPDPYADYSAPWFHTHAEVRGAGAWITAAALARPTFRNFYTPDRRDPFIGFRTACAL